MNRKINLDLISLKFIYNKNRSYIFSIGMILISIILFFVFVIPQFKALLQAQKEVKELSEKMEISKANLNMITNISDNVLNSQYDVLVSALPLSKDAITILNSIYGVAQKAGVNLGSFSFSVGDLYKSEKGDNFPVVRLSVPINAGIREVNTFIEIMSKTFPLSEVGAASIKDSSAIVSLAFYYKPAPAYSPDNKLSSISQKGLNLVKQLDGFRNESLLFQPPVPAATSSATQ
jgi:hypothetical protein